MLPKVLGVASAFIRRDPAARNPGRFLGGAAIETIFSILIAPILMLTQTSAVLEILRGKDSGWTVQRREGEPPPLSEVIRFHKSHIAVGAALAITCSLVSLYVFSWMAPIFLGQLLAVGLSVVTSRVTPAWINRALATAEDTHPPPIILAVSERYADWARRLGARR